MGQRLHGLLERYGRSEEDEEEDYYTRDLLPGAMSCVTALFRTEKDVAKFSGTRRDVADFS